MELFILPADLRLVSVGVAGRKLHFHFAFLSFHFSPLGSSASHLPSFLHFSPGEGHRPRILAEENYPGLFSHFLSLNPVLKWQRITRIPTDGGVNTTEIGQKGPEEWRKGVIGFSEFPFAFSDTTLSSRGTAISWTSVSASSWPAPYVLVITTLKEFVIVKWIWHFTPDCFQKKTWENFYLVSCLTRRLWETLLLMRQPQPAWHKLTQIHNIPALQCIFHLNQLTTDAFSCRHGFSILFFSRGGLWYPSH